MARNNWFGTPNNNDSRFGSLGNHDGTRTGRVLLGQGCDGLSDRNNVLSLDGAVSSSDDWWSGQTDVEMVGLGVGDGFGFVADHVITVGKN